MYLFKLEFSSFLDICPEVGLLDHIYGSSTFSFLGTLHTIQECTVDSYISLGGCPENYAKWKNKPVPRGYILYDFTYMTFLK